MLLIPGHVIMSQEYVKFVSMTQKGTAANNAKTGFMEMPSYERIAKVTNNVMFQ